MNSLPKLAKFVIAINLFLFLAQVIVANRLTTAGLTLKTLSWQEDGLKKENEILERKIATFSSLTQVLRQAQAAGFVKPQTLYLVPEFPVAAGNLNVNTPR